jgi:hypothetical protein
LTRMALVCGDGLPVSGLLTIFRNFIGLGRETGLVTGTITADLGYSWRPDKPSYYPRGLAEGGYPPWLNVVNTLPAGDPTALADEWLAIRAAVAHAAELSAAERDGLRARIETLAGPYEEYFVEWFQREDVDWVFAVNMTLSDAVPVTLGLHRAAARHWDDGRPGGVVFWDHDLFASYAVHEGDERVYPCTPNEFTPVPGGHRCHVWIVPTEQLEREAATYPTSLVPRRVPYVLPRLADDALAERHRQFLARHDLDPARPIVLAPVRVFRVKGVELAVSLLAALRRECRRHGDPLPYLLVFGALDEDPDYTADVLSVAEREDVGDALRFLGGVPVSSFRNAAGDWVLDEVDLLAVARLTGGGVFYTPNRPDVESVGLGPALAAVAGIPVAVTSYRAFEGAYGPDLAHVRVGGSDDMQRAAAEFRAWLTGRRDCDSAVVGRLAHNAEQIKHHFPDVQSRQLLRDMALMRQPTDRAPV